MSKAKAAKATAARQNRPRGEILFVLLFLGLFTLLDGLFFGVVTDTAAYRSYLVLLARLSTWLLSSAGAEVTRQGTMMFGDVDGVEVAQGCDCVQPWLLFVCAIVALRASPGRTAIACLVGTVMLFSTNVVRIASLFLIQSHWQEGFEVMHQAIWPLVLILSVLGMWILLARWILSRQVPSVHAE